MLGLFFLVKLVKLIEFSRILRTVKGEICMNKKGRPPKNDSKNRQYRLRMTQEEYENLEKLAAQNGVTMSDILRTGIELLCVLDKNFSKNSPKT